MKAPETRVAERIVGYEYDASTYCDEIVRVGAIATVAHIRLQRRGVAGLSAAGLSANASGLSHHHRTQHLPPRRLGRGRCPPVGQYAVPGAAFDGSAACLIGKSLVMRSALYGGFAVALVAVGYGKCKGFSRLRAMVSTSHRLENLKARGQ